MGDGRWAAALLDFFGKILPFRDHCSILGAARKLAGQRHTVETAIIRVDNTAGRRLPGSQSRLESRNLEKQTTVLYRDVQNLCHRQPDLLTGRIAERQGSLLYSNCRSDDLQFIQTSFF
jgi:hypothetical protein